MGFQSINEADQFSFEDCQISSIRVGEAQIELEVEALIVEPANSQNRNFTESYAGTTRIKLQDGKLLAGWKDGYKYYNADGVLQKETPDEELSPEQLRTFLKKCSGAYLYELKLKGQGEGKDRYQLGVEFVSEEAYDTIPADSYRLDVECTRLVISWDAYLNRVQR
jgi:hypothetical protein